MTDSSAIRDEFNKKKDAFRTQSEKDGLKDAVGILSRVIGDLKDAGLDVSLDLIAGGNEMAFYLFPNPSLTMPVTGILRLGNMHRLLGVATELDKASVLQVAISHFDYRLEGTTAKLTEGRNINPAIRGKIFDLRKSTIEGELRDYLLVTLARNDVVAEFDTMQSLENTGHTNKPLLKAPRKQA